jgi:hypothetical protein
VILETPSEKRLKPNPFQTPAKLLPRVVKPAGMFSDFASPISPLSPPSYNDRMRMEAEEGEEDPQVDYPNFNHQSISNKKVWGNRFKVPSFVTPPVNIPPPTPVSIKSRQLLPTTPTKNSIKLNDYEAAIIPQYHSAPSKPVMNKFRTPSSLINSDGTKKIKNCSPAVEVSKLERRLLVLQQALKYLREEESTTSEDGEGGKGKLERLGDMWLEIGK